MNLAPKLLKPRARPSHRITSTGDPSLCPLVVLPSETSWGGTPREAEAAVSHTPEKSCCKPTKPAGTGETGAPDAGKAVGIPLVMDAAVENFLENSPIRCNNRHEVVFTLLA